MRKIATMSFRECGDTLTDIVARKDLFKSKEDFLNYCLTKDENIEFEYDGFENVPAFTIAAVKEKYIRYCPKIEDGVYIFCDNSKGSIAVYALEIAS